MYFCVRNCARIDSEERQTSAELGRHGSRGKRRESVREGGEGGSVSDAE